MTYKELQALRALGYPDAKLRALAKSYKGQSVTVTTGDTTSSPQVPGTAKVLLGFSVYADDGTLNNPGQLQVSIVLNNETIYDRVGYGTICNTFQGSGSDQYTECMRTLTGKDVLQVIFTSLSGGTVDYTLIYLS